MRKTLASTGLVAVVAMAATLHTVHEARPVGAVASQRHNDFYYKSYDTAYRPACLARTVTRYDYWGKEIQENVRICG